MKIEYEILESYKKEKENWSYLRHKNTGLEIAFHQCETENAGFSFCFRTPIEKPYLGINHVTEHCVLYGSKKHDIPFLDLLGFSIYSNFNAITDRECTRFFLYSPIEEEVLKMLPILADYVFFPSLSEESFMQECFRVEFSSDGDDRKKEIAGVIYNEIKNLPTETTYQAGLHYKLHELTNKKVKEYHKKYYRADNCLFVYNGNADLEEILDGIENLLSEIDKSNYINNIPPRKAMTITECISRIPFVQTPESKVNSDDVHWYLPEKEDIASHMDAYWISNLSPIMPFCMDEKYAYSINLWTEENEKEEEVPLFPAKKTVKKIISEYLSKFTSEEYKTKLKKLHDWQNHEAGEEARKIMEPLAVEKYDLVLLETEKSLKNYFKKQEKWISIFQRYHSDVEIKTDKRNSLAICIRQSRPMSSDFYGEYSLCFFLQRFLTRKLRQMGKFYSVDCCYDEPFAFRISTVSADKPEKSLVLIKEHIKQLTEYDFTETDLLLIKSMIYSFIFAETQKRYFFSEEIFKIKSEDLHKAVIRFWELLNEDSTVIYEK